jgi:hypothetical protein
VKAQFSYPDELEPTATERIVLPSGRQFDFPKATPRFRKWLGSRPSSIYGRKELLDYQGECVFAELAILRIFQAAGWDGRWIDTFGGKTRTGYWGDGVLAPLPAEQELALKTIRNAAGLTGGCYDVFCWRENAVCFAEAKRLGHDRIRQTQLRWLEGAIQTGIPASALLIVEWTASDAS